MTSPTSARPWSRSPRVRRLWPLITTTTITCSGQQTGGNTSITTGSLIVSASDARWDRGIKCNVDVFDLIAFSHVESLSALKFPYSCHSKSSQSKYHYITVHCSAQILLLEYCENVKLSSFILLWSGPNGIKYLCERVKMREMRLPRRAAYPATGPGLGVEGRDWHLVITLSHQWPMGIISPAKVPIPEILVSKVSQFNKLRRNWGHSFRKRTNDQLIFFSAENQLLSCSSQFCATKKQDKTDN